jgi:hypothetical protein
MPLTFLTCLATYCYYISEFQYSLWFAIAAFLVVCTNTAEVHRGRAGLLNLAMMAIYAVPVGYLMTIA